MEAILLPYDESAFEEISEVMLQDSMPLRTLREPARSQAIEESLREHRGIVRVIRDAASGAFVGYCDVRDVRKDDWELGIVLLRRFWHRGYGTAAITALMRELHDDYGRESFIVRIDADNRASIGLFRKLGATPAGLSRAVFFPTEEDAARFERAHPELVDDCVREMGRLFDVDPIKLTSHALLFRLSWPVPGGL